MWQFILFLLDLLSLGLISDPKRRTATETTRTFGQPVERLRWVIYGLIGAGILFLIVAVVAVLMAN